MAFIDHLGIVTPDYTDTILTKSANFDIPIPGAYKQVVNETDGGSRKVVTMKTTPDATVTLKFTGVTQAEADTLSDLYYNPLKAYGMARSYIWQHSQTQEFFTLQNISEYNETATIMSYGRYDISFTAKILGVPGLTVTTTGATIDFAYSGTASFITKYSDGTESLLADPPLKDFGTVSERKTLVISYYPDNVTTLNLSYSSANSLTKVSSYTSLANLFLFATSITDAPDLSNNTALIYCYLNDNNITEASLSACVDQLYDNRVILGGNPCIVKLENNNGLTADAIAKIDGTGIYVGDGLIDNGFTVTY